MNPKCESEFEIMLSIIKIFFKNVLVTKNEKCFKNYLLLFSHFRNKIVLKPYNLTYDTTCAIKLHIQNAVKIYASVGTSVVNFTILIFFIILMNMTCPMSMLTFPKLK